MNPWPCAYTFLNGKTLKVYACEVVDFVFGERCKCGTVVCANSKQGLIVATKDGFLRLTDIQAEGGKRMSDSSYLLGHKIEIGMVLNG